MKLFRKKIILYSGWDLNEVNKIMDCLSDNKIPFKFHMKDQGNRLVGRGTTRSNFGNAGMRQDYLILYTIKIHQKDEHTARQKINEIMSKKQ